MRALLDTHVFLWWITDSPKLSSRAREIISDGGNTLYLSAASGWEMVVKARLGKLELPGNPVAFIFEQLSANDIIELPVRMNHTLHVYSLPPHHRDPFDRLLVSQAQLDILPIISADKQIAEYDVKVIW